jgi:hypothetical protein
MKILVTGSAARRAYDDVNLKVNEFLYRRADIEDVVSAHLLAMQIRLQRSSSGALWCCVAGSAMPEGDL